MNSAAVDLFSQSEVFEQAEGWKLEVSSGLEVLIAAMKRYLEAHSELSSIVSFDSSHSSLNEMTCIEDYFNEWICKKCEEATASADNISHLEIDKSRLPKEVREFSFRRRDSFFDEDPQLNGKSIFDAEPEALAALLVGSYDFKGLEKALDNASHKIESEGFKCGAKTLGCEFRLVAVHSHHDDTVKIKQQKGRFILETSHYGSWKHDRMSSIRALLPSAKTFELESGVTGLRACLRGILEEEERTPGCGETRVESRTKVCSGEPVEAVFFKDKLKYSFDPEVFEAFVGFLKEFSEHPVKKIEIC